MTSIGQVQSKFLTVATPDQPFKLESGAELPEVVLAYETYGTLSAKKDNAILVFHALTGSQHAAGYNPGVEGIDHWTDDCREGWWDLFIGPDKVLDTDRYFIICANYLGGCYGSTGPLSINPTTGKRYGPDFPDVMISDIARSQRALLDHFGIEQLLAVIGGSMGGMLALDFALQFPNHTRLVIPIATGATTSSLAKLHNFEQLLALQSDPNFADGHYYDGPSPHMGLILARIICHKNFVDVDVMEQRARGYIIQDRTHSSVYQLRHQIESYMLYQGQKFAQRFDVNSYIKILTAWQTFDLAKNYGEGVLAMAMRRSANHRYLVVSIDSDVCFWPEEQERIVDALKNAGIDYRYITVHSDKGHDSFLLEPSLYIANISYILADELEQIQTA